MALTYYAEFHGLVSKAVLIEVETMNLGGDDPGGIRTPSDVVLGLTASKYSPRLLQAFVEQTAHKIVIKGFHVNVAGVEENFLAITLTQARIASYRLGAAWKGKVRDTLHLTFATLDYDYLDTGTDYVWQPA